jgi:colanic acid/amylovoran biosynthesis glycosyltransferase
VETFPKLSETFISGKALWLLEQGVPLRVIDKYPGQREYGYFSPEVAAAFQTCTAGLYPGGNTLSRLFNRSRMILDAWAYGLPRYPLELREFQHMARLASGISGGFYLPGQYRRQKGQAQQAIDRFLDFHWAMRERPQCIHVHHGFNALDWVPVKRVLGDRVRLVVSFLGRDVTVDAQDNPQMYQPLFEVGDLYLASSPYLRELAINAGCPADRIHVHPVEIDTDYFYPVPKPEALPNTVQILSVGRLVWEKDYDTALRAVARLKTLLPEATVHYAIVGDGPLREELEHLVQTLQLEGNVTFHGARDREWVRALYGQADLFLITSISEGLGAAALEAQACGVPVVATDVGGLPYAVSHEKTGLLAPPGEDELLASLMQRLFTDPTGRLQMGAAARQHVEANFSARVLYPRLLSYYGITAPEPVALLR